MRWLLLVVLAACAQLPAHRPLVVDNVPYGADRAAVRAWHVEHGWCFAFAFPTTDVFSHCEPHPYLNESTPGMLSMIRYDDRGWSTAYAVYTPVPCTMQGRCDQLLLPSGLNPDAEFVNPDGLMPDLADRGRGLERHDTVLPDMPSRMYDALRTEIAGRYKLHRTWADPNGFGETWETPVTDVGLFVSSNGAWIIETHEIKPAARAKTPPHAHPAGTFVSL